ncbi:restriction endonuclease [Muricoccus vinaceus]
MTDERQVPPDLGANKALTIGQAFAGMSVAAAIAALVYWLWYEDMANWGAVVFWTIAAAAVVGPWLNTSQAYMDWAASERRKTSAAKLEKKAAASEEKRRLADVDAHVKRVRELVLNKLPELRRARSAAVGKWGELDLAKWEAEKSDFSRAILMPALGAAYFRIVERVPVLIDEAMATPEFGDPLTMTGIDYEEFCAAALRDAGWLVTGTKVTGDQGVDLVATLGAWRVAIQCKRYSGSVPNSAVQEVEAGAAFYGANAKVVVSTGAYTAAARSLASATGTLLLNYEQLPTLEMLLVEAKGAP